MRIEHHPYLNVWVREDGCVYLPQSGKHKAHWTYGSGDSLGYMQVGIAGKRYLVHRLVAEAYFGEIPEGCEIDHINRDRKDNRVENIRIVSRFENRRNRADHDRVTECGGTHVYEDAGQAYRENAARYRTRHPEKVREQQARYRKNKCKTYRNVRFSDGSRHWLPNSEAVLLLAIPLNERIFKE